MAERALVEARRHDPSPAVRKKAGWYAPGGPFTGARLHVLPVKHGGDRALGCVSCSSRLGPALGELQTTAEGARGARVDHSIYDKRKYPIVDVREGYGAWVHTYEQTVEDEMDLSLLDRLQTVDWAAPRLVLDLACGTGRIGTWLRRRCAAAKLGRASCRERVW